MEWISNVKNNPPPDGVLVKVKGSDRFGEWFGTAMRKDYKKPPLGTSKRVAKKAFRTGWRWVDRHGESLNDQAVESWSSLTPQEKPNGR